MVDLYAQSLGPPWFSNARASVVISGMFWGSLRSVSRGDEVRDDITAHTLAQPRSPTPTPWGSRSAGQRRHCQQCRLHGQRVLLLGEAGFLPPTTMKSYSEAILGTVVWMLDADIATRDRYSIAQILDCSSCSNSRMLGFYPLFISASWQSRDDLEFNQSFKHRWRGHGASSCATSA